MRAAVLQAYNEPMVIEEITPPTRAHRRAHAHRRQRRLPLRPERRARASVPLPPPRDPRPRGRRHGARGGQRRLPRRRSATASSPRSTPACGNCFFCLRDQSQLCETMGAAHASAQGHARRRRQRHRGTSGLGTFADEMTVDESMLVKVETDLPADQLALIGCGITTGVGAALNTAQIKPGATVTVIGCGGVGQSVLQGARIAGASRIFAVDPVEMKRKTAEQFGATDLIDPADGDPVEQVRAATGGRGTDYAFEVIGLPETILQAYEWPAPAAPRSSSACRASTTPSPSRRWGSSPATRRCSAACTARRAGAARLPPLRAAGRDRPPRHRLDGVAPHPPRRGERRVPGDGGGRGHPQRHHLTSPGTPAEHGSDPKCLTRGVGATRIAGLMGLSARDRAILDFERGWWSRPGPKEAAIRTELGSPRPATTRSSGTSSTCPRPMSTTRSR